MNRIFTLIFLCSMGMAAYGQEDAGYLELVRAEVELKSMFDQLYSQEVPGSQLALYHDIDSAFNHALKLPGSFEHDWSKLDQIGKLASDDGRIKVFSWLYRVSMNDYRYTAYIQVMDKNDAELFKLEPAADDNIHTKDFDQEISHWDGKVYYDLVTKEYKRKVFYTLLGADYNNTSTSVKTIEVVTVQRGKPVFRDDQFLVGGTVEDRIVLEYSADLAVSARYNEELDMIVYDHLLPLHPLYHGNYQFYGPDGSYDGLTFTEGVWVLEEDVDARNE
ncbi:MAG: hypothetical protein P1P82_15995 [Bacteroidales bacterium]|nr:hypothetical protein [Bacteroidales bacterium]MDT8432749.1 hypothetical protein [Bacteroidales bacterium]